MKRQTAFYLSIALFVALLVYGVYALLYYIGVPLHAGIIVPKAALGMLREACAETEFLCQGARGLFPFIIYSFSRLEPFYAYGLFSVILYGLWIGWRYMQTGSHRLQSVVRPWYLPALFVGCLWLLFTTLSFSSTDDVSIRRVIDPQPQVYTNVDKEGLSVLRRNFDDLKEAGCLRLTTQTFNGAGVYNLTTFCTQKSFIVRVLSPLLVLLLLVLNFLVLGRAFMQLLRLKPPRLLVEGAVAAGLGAAALTALLWLLSVLSYHIDVLALYTQLTGWILLIAIPAVGYAHTLYWWKELRSASWEYSAPWYSIRTLLVWGLLSYLALNYLTVVRPFPIGWDDLGSYLNRPRLLVSYGHFIFSMAQFQWEYLTSLGYLLFGYEGYYGATVAMMINWMAGFGALFAVFVFGNTFLGKGRGVLAALLYYTLPMVGHFSFADMKIDNAVFMTGALMVLCVFSGLFRRDEDAPVKSALPWFVAAGILGGFAFAIKATSIMVLMAMGAIMMGVLLHWSAFVGSLFLSVAVYATNGISLSTIAERVAGSSDGFSEGIVILVLAVLGLGCIGAGVWLRRQSLKPTLQAVGLFIAGFLVAIVPWVTHNNMLHGKSPLSFTIGAPNTFSPIMDIRGTFEDPNNKYTVRRLPEELALDPEHPACQKSGKKEELDRYWGFSQGWGHYLTLPWRILMNLDSGGYYVTTAAGLSLLPLLLLLPFFWRRKEAAWARWLWLGSAYMLVQWVFLANGIIWYGVGMFLGFVILLELLVDRAPDLPNRILLSILLGLSILITLAMRTWQFESQKNLFEYPLGKSSPEVMIERTVPHYNDIADAVMDRYNSMPDRPYLYRVGTFIPYFIPRNLEVIGRIDHQLDGFNCLHQERDAALTVKRLKALGFNAFIFDTNTATIERDPEGSLHKKVELFVEFVNNPESGLNVILNDPAAGVGYILIP